MRPSVRRALLPLALLLLARTAAPLVATAQSTDLAERIEALEGRARRIEEVRGHEAGEDALTHARRALRAARGSERRGDRAAAERHAAIADAALVLADRAAARRRAHLAIEEARARHEAARRRAQVAREALEAALAERARARRGEAP